MTRDELVERMARASYEASYANYLKICERGWGHGPLKADEWPTFDQLGTRAKEHRIALATAALTELEKHAVVVPAEPTQKMWGEGQDALKAEQRDNAWGDAWDLVEGIDERKIYRAMIAARPR